MVWVRRQQPLCVNRKGFPLRTVATKSFGMLSSQQQQVPARHQLSLCKLRRPDCRGKMP